MKNQPRSLGRRENRCAVLGAMSHVPKAQKVGSFCVFQSSDEGMTYVAK
ncbi:MAG: hypothetical protein WCP45_08030 [Verrucomicrobiota bacterium]